METSFDLPLRTNRLRAPEKTRADEIARPSTTGLGRFCFGPQTIALPAIEAPRFSAIVSTLEKQKGSVFDRHRELWRSTRWTKLDQPAYAAVIASLREVSKDREYRSFWKIEEFWNGRGAGDP